MCLFACAFLRLVGKATQGEAETSRLEELLRTIKNVGNAMKRKVGRRRGRARRRRRRRWRKGRG